MIPIVTNPALWERIKKKVTAQFTEGTAAGEWSARKAQLCVRLYKQAGGRYRGPKSSNNSLVKWGRQHWRTKSGKPSSLTGERYLPENAIKNLTSREYSRTTAAKRRSMSKGKQYSRQPRDISRKTKWYRL
jgi:hypothetical protein